MKNQRKKRSRTSSSQRSWSATVEEKGRSSPSKWILNFWGSGRVDEECAEWPSSMSEFLTMERSVVVGLTLSSTCCRSFVRTVRLISPAGVDLHSSCLFPPPPVAAADAPVLLPDITSSCNGSLLRIGRFFISSRSCSSSSWLGTTCARCRRIELTYSHAWTSYTSTKLQSSSKRLS